MQDSSVRPGASPDSHSLANGGPASNTTGEPAWLELHRRALLGDQVAIVAHELNNILTPLISRADFVLRSGKDADLRVTLEKVLVHARRAGALARRILENARETDAAADEAPMSMQDLVHEALGLLVRPLEKDGHALEMDIPSDLAVHRGACALMQIVLNLLLNARAALPEHRGRVGISAHKDRESAVVEVSDNGRGLTENQIAEIVNPFLAADDVSASQHERWPGVGVGLAACRLLAQRFGGTIRFTGSPTAGCAAQVRWPLA